LPILLVLVLVLVLVLDSIELKFIQTKKRVAKNATQRVII